MSPRISMTKDEAKASIKLDGMLAPVIDEFRAHVVEDNAAWFEFARRLNRLAARHLADHVRTIDGREIRDPISLSFRLTSRVAHTFGAAIVLAERGQIIEANTLSRSIYEAGFWIGYLRASPLKAAADFITEEMTGQAGRDAAVKKVMAGHVEVASQLAAQEAQTKEALKGRERIPSLARMAELAGFPEHYAYYKVLCGTSAHPTLSSTHGYMTKQDDGDFYGVAFGPDTDNVGQALGFACHAYMMAVTGFTGLLGFLGRPGEMPDMILELNALMEGTATKAQHD